MRKHISTEEMSRPGASENDHRAARAKWAELKNRVNVAAGKRRASSSEGSSSATGSSSSLSVNMAVFAQASDERKAHEVRLQKDSVSIGPVRAQSPVHG